MECKATVSKKLGSSFNGTSIYDGVFSGSAPFRSSSFSSSSSSRPEDYAEIFGGSRDSRRSSIPVLDVPALHERKMTVDVRSSKLEYSKIFGDGSDVGQLSFEDVVVDPRKMRNMSRQEPTRAHTRSSSEVSFSSLEDNQVLRNASHPSLDKGKKNFNVSYNKSVGGGKGGINGTIHVAQLHDVPGYASVVDEEDPSKQLKGDKPITNDAQSKYGADDGSLKAKNAKQSKSSLSSSSPDKEYSKDVLRNRSRSHSSLFEGYEFGLRTEPSEVQASTGCSPNVSCSKGNSEFVVSPSNVSQSGVGIGSPTYFDEEVDANSVAAASADAVRKAIEKAQARIKIAKEMMGRGKEAFQANVESKGSWERRREHKRASKLREKDSHEQRLKEYGKLNSTKVGSEVTDIGNHVRHSDNVANRTAGHESREDQTYDRQGGAVKRDETKLSGTITESKEAEAKTLMSRQGISINKVGVSDDCEKLMKRTAELTIENATGNGTILTAARAMPLQEVHDKTLNKLSADEGAHECDSNSNKLESGIQLQHVEREEMEFEVKEEQLDSAKELIGHSDQGEYCGNPEEFHESSSEINLDENQLEEKTVRAEDCVQEENEEKQPESHKAEGYIKSRVISDNEESCGWRIDGKQENEVREGESSERECSWEKYEEKPIEGHEGKDSVRSREVPDTKESITCEKLAGVEEKRERQGESCERDFVHRSEVTYDKQETKEYNGFNFGVDAKQWLDQMKEILHVRINSFLDGKENSRRHESGAVENTSQIEPEGSEDILEETRGMEATREPYDAQDSMVDDNIRIGINIRSESKVQDVANEGKVDHSEELTGTMEVFGDEENKESADITGDDSEDEENEVIIETTNLSFEEKEVLVSDSINLNEGEASNLSTEEEDNSSGNLEDMCGSETSDLTGASLEADGERQVQGAVAVIGFSENDVKSGFTSIKFGFLQSDPYVEEPEETCEMGEHVEGSDARKNKFHGEKGAEILSNKEREAEDVISQGEPETGVSDADRESDNELNVKENQLDVLYERKEERIKLKQETTTDQTTDSNEEDRTATKIANEKETGDCLETMDPERDSFKKRDERERERERKRERETEREREKERLAVERAIREARERAFAEARERAERAAVDKATAEAHQRVIAHAREKLGKASSETLNKPAEKTSAEARLKAERAAVERATAEARERALEKAMSEKLSGASKDNRVRQKSSYDAQRKSSGNSSNHRNSNSSDNGVPRSSDRSNGANSESPQRSKARLERHQRTAERAAKALAEKNMRDLLAQREQAERNRLAEALDADIKRWSSGKQGNLRALLSTLQYILGPDSGWQAVTLMEIVTAAAVKKAYRKATLCVHPDKLQQRGASLQQKYICEKVFDLLKEAWNRFSAEEK